MERFFAGPGSRWLFTIVCTMVLFVSGCQKEEDPGSSGPGDEITLAVDVGDSEIPYIHIRTNGVAIENEPKVPAEMRIFVNKQEVQFANIGIEYRGSTSFRISDKKSFGIETWDESGADIDVGFFDFPEEEDFILNGHIVNIEGDFIIDRTLMYHYFGYELFRSMGRYASRCQFVEAEINGQYQGVYVFMEKLKRDNDRIDINRLNPDENEGEDLTGGYILKIDKTNGGDLGIVQPLEYYEDNWADDATYTPEISFRSQYDINGNVLDFEPYREPYHPDQFKETYFLYEYPDADEITDQQKAYIQSYIDDFETALLTDDFNTTERTYTDYIDMGSFVDYFLLNELVRNVDGYRLSTYMSKDKNGKLEMGPVWDLNIGYYTGDRIPWDDWVINYNNYVDSDPWMMPFWWPRLLEDPIFRQAVKDRWNELRQTTLATSELHRIVNEASVYLQDNGAIDRNYTIWDPNGFINYNDEVQSLRGFLEIRSNWMDQEISAF
jgi:hypothetical protein